MKRFKITDLLIGFLFTLLFLSISVIITINFRPLYYMDIEILDIEKNSGYRKEEILANYNALIDYSSPFYQGELSFPTFEASESGIKHFKEVKDIFTIFYMLGAITLVLSIIIILYKKKKRDFKYLFISSVTAIALPLIVGLLMAIDFDTTFMVFHKIFFNNDDWIFNPITDPVIQILPAAFFMHCAIMIIALVLLASLICFLTYHRLKSHTGIKYRKTQDLKL